MEITPLNELYDEMSEAVKLAVMDESLHKAEAKKLAKRQTERRPKSRQKALKKAAKSGAEEDAVEQKPRVFVVNFPRQYQCLGGDPSA